MQKVEVLNIDNRFSFKGETKVYKCTFINSVNTAQHKEKIELHYIFGNTEKHEIICSRKKLIIIKHHSSLK